MHRFAASCVLGFCLVLEGGVAEAADNPNDLKTLSVAEAKELIASAQGTLSLNNVTELSLEAAQVLSQYKGDLRLNGLTSLSPAVARALSNRSKGSNLSLNGLKAISVVVAEALASRPERGGVLFLDGLTTLSGDAAEALAKVPTKLTLNGLQTLSPEAARGLAKHQSKLTLFALPDLSDEAAEALSHHPRCLLLNGLTRLSSAPLTATLLKFNDGFLKLSKVKTISDEAAKVLAEYKGRPLSLPGLTELSDANAALLRANENISLPARYGSGPHVGVGQPNEVKKGAEKAPTLIKENSK